MNPVNILKGLVQNKKKVVSEFRFNLENQSS